ncbi:hypothetical protein E4U24_002741 [Claviceps purpurea]|nr:hypothetical protein E4U51_007972 [Claviceps purpurea]KAG6248340.1 hypothetical protein E4U24_002741 [Claviceps purpurea]
MESDRSGFSIRLDETSPGLRKGPSAWPEKAGEASWIDIFHAARVSAARKTVNRMDRLYFVCFLWTNVSYLVGSWLGGRTAGGDREGDVDRKPSRYVGSELQDLQGGFPNSLDSGVLG